MSAGSKTEPGGYSNSQALKQFEIHDDRSAMEIAEMIKRKTTNPFGKIGMLY